MEERNPAVLRAFPAYGLLDELFHDVVDDWSTGRLVAELSAGPKARVSWCTPGPGHLRELWAEAEERLKRYSRRTA